MTSDLHLDASFVSDLNYNDTIRLKDGRVGLVKYVGLTELSEEIMIGIHLRKGDGEHSGYVGEREYFSCPMEEGTFAFLSMVDRIEKKYTLSARVGFEEDIFVVDYGHGIVRFIGRTEFSESCMYGVELQSERGHSDGSWDDIRYFRCAPRYGVFVHKNRIRQLKGMETPMSASDEDDDIFQSAVADFGKATATTLSSPRARRRKPRRRVEVTTPGPRSRSSKVVTLAVKKKKKKKVVKSKDDSDMSSSSKSARKKKKLRAKKRQEQHPLGLTKSQSTGKVLKKKKSTLKKKHVPMPMVSHLEVRSATLPLDELSAEDIAAFVDGGGDDVSTARRSPKRSRISPKKIKRKSASGVKLHPKPKTKLKPKTTAVSSKKKTGTSTTATKSGKKKSAKAVAAKTTAKTKAKTRRQSETTATEGSHLGVGAKGKSRSRKNSNTMEPMTCEERDSKMEAASDSLRDSKKKKGSVKKKAATSKTPRTRSPKARSPKARSSPRARTPKMRSPKRRSSPRARSPKALSPKARMPRVSSPRVVVKSSTDYICGPLAAASPLADLTLESFTPEGTPEAMAISSAPIRVRSKTSSKTTSQSGSNPLKPLRKSPRRKAKVKWQRKISDTCDSSTKSPRKRSATSDSAKSPRKRKGTGDSSTKSPRRKGSGKSVHSRKGSGKKRKGSVIMHEFELDATVEVEEKAEEIIRPRALVTWEHMKYFHLQFEAHYECLSAEQRVALVKKRPRPPLLIYALDIIKQRKKSLGRSLPRTPMVYRIVIKQRPCGFHIRPLERLFDARFDDKKMTDELNAYVCDVDDDVVTFDIFDESMLLSIDDEDVRGSRYVDVYRMFESAECPFTLELVKPPSRRSFSGTVPDWSTFAPQTRERSQTIDPYSRSSHSRGRGFSGGGPVIERAHTFEVVDHERKNTLELADAIIKLKIEAEAEHKASKKKWWQRPF